MAKATVEMRMPQRILDTIEREIRKRGDDIQQAIRDAHRAGYEAGLSRGRLAGVQRPDEQGAWEDYREAVYERRDER
jgi:hypothetical protein